MKRRQTCKMASLILAAALLLGALGLPVLAQMEGGLPGDDSIPYGLSDAEPDPDLTVLMGVKPLTTPTLYQVVPAGTPLSALDLPPTLEGVPPSPDAPAAEPAPTVPVPVVWTPNVAYHPDVPGDYIFTCALPENVVLLGRAANLLPEIEVSVRNAAEEEPPAGTPPDDAPPIDDSSSEASSSSGASSAETPSSEASPTGEESGGVPQFAAPPPNRALAAPAAAPLPVTVDVYVRQDDGSLFYGVPAPYVQIRRGATYIPYDQNELDITYNKLPYGPTIGLSDIDSVGYYRVRVVYESADHTMRGENACNFTVTRYGEGPHWIWSPDLPVGGYIDNSGYVTSGQAADMRARIEDIPGFGSVSSRRIQYMDLTARSADGSLYHPPGSIRVHIPYPSGTGRRTHDFAAVHWLRDGRAERLSVSEDYSGVSFWTGSLSPFALAWRVTSTDGWDDDDDIDEDADRYSAFKEGEYDFWMTVKRRIERADDGSLIEARARGYDKFPEVVMRALRENDGVSLRIAWNGGDDIYIPAGQAQVPDGLRMFWPLKLLADLYDGSAPDKVELDDKEEVPPPPAAPPAASPAPPSPSQGTGGWRPTPGTGGAVVEAPETASSVTPAKTNEREGLAETVELAEAVARDPKVLEVHGNTPAPREKARVPDGLVLALAVMTVLSLFGVFVGVWLFTKKKHIRY